MEEMGKLSYEHFEIKKELYNERFCALAIESNPRVFLVGIKKLKDQILPRDKVKVFTNIFEMVTSYLNNCTSKPVISSADNVTPFAIYVTLKACPVRLHSVIE